MVLLTGTPVQSRCAQLITLLKLIEPEIFDGMHFVNEDLDRDVQFLILVRAVCVLD